MKAVLQKLVEGSDLTPAEVESAFESIFQGEATPAQMGAFLVALWMKGETPAEIAAAATVMRRRATPVRLPPGRVGAPVRRLPPDEGCPRALPSLARSFPRPP